jgi:ribosome-binding protein aMBF1 (putative translation factor)
MCARRISLEKPPSESEERKVERLQATARQQIGARIKNIRTKADLSLRALAMKSNVSPTYLSEVERGLRSPTSDLLVRLSYFMNVSPAFFFTDES